MRQWRRGLTVIQAVHISELRAAIDAVYVAAGATPPPYTDPVLVPGVTDIRAVHLTELRAARANAPAEIGATRYYHLDALGSVRAVTDAAGATVRRHDYTAFGEAPTPGLGADARRFTGKERDTETGLDYFAARYYHASSGRPAVCAATRRQRRWSGWRVSVGIQGGGSRERSSKAQLL